MSPNPRLYARQRRGSRNRSDPRGLLGLLLFAGVPLCSYGGRLGAAECSRLAPYFLSTDQRIALCRQATTGAPADCARKAYAAPKLSGSHVLDLCSGETSDFPGLCAAGLSRSIAKNLSPDLRIELCKGARSDAPAKCAEHSVNSKRKPQLVVDVCKGASSIGPAECLDLLPKDFTHEEAVELCNGAQDLGPAVCANVKGQLSYGSELTSTLCRGASGPGPADCFRRSTLIATLSTADRVELCGGAISDGPARCAGHIRDHHISSPQKAALCRGASGTAPATCLASTPPSMPIWDRVELCQDAAEASPTAPVTCLKAVPHDLPTSFAVALCRKASNHKAAAECAKVARHTVGDSPEGLLTLCGDASSAAPAHCAKAAFRVGADRDLAVVLCAGSDSLAPASCFGAAPRQVPPDVRVEACAGARSNSPAVCLAAATSTGGRGQGDGEAVCPLDPVASSPPQRRIDYWLAARLCRNTSDDGPAKCARAASPRMSDGDVEVLCAAGRPPGGEDVTGDDDEEEVLGDAEGLPKGEETARCATAALMVGFSGASAASLCRGASSDAPAACAAMATLRIGEAGRLAVCTGASSNAPARCVNSLPFVRTPSTEEIAECRAAVPHPSGLHITNLGYDGEELFPDQAMHVTLEVWDQWGGRIDSDSSTVVRASIALRGSNGAVVNADGRFNTSSDGIVHFSRLSFSGSGNLTVQFYIDGNNNGSTSVGAANANVPVPLEAARVIVAETEHGAIIRRCRGIFSQLACPWPLLGEGNRTAASTDGVADSEPPQPRPMSIATEAVSTVAGGAGAAWYVMTCQQVLEDNGVYVAYVSSRGTEPRSALLWYHPGIEALETGAGLPTRDKPAWDRLGVDRDASAREVRRAYYRQSLLWHPDRWVRYKMHSARAQDVFQIVSDAYAWMVASSAEEHDIPSDATS